MNGPTPRLARGLVTAALSSALLAAAVGTALPASADDKRGEEPRRKPTLIQVKVNDLGPHVRPNLLGTNNRYILNGMGLWNGQSDTPNQQILDLIARAGVTSLRFPGGTTTSMYRWKDAIDDPATPGDDDRECQVDGHGHYRQQGFPDAHRNGLDYGPDEFMEVIDATGAAPLIMMPFVSQTPSDAAAWVEYMNDPFGGKNPLGGIAWAKLRAANGHRAPYGVRRWEVGNESHVHPGRYGFSDKPARAVHQYIGGGVRSIKGENLGKACRHPVAGVHSSGRINQRFDPIFTPAKIRRVTVQPTNGSDRWRKVGPADLADARPRAKVYTVAGRGTVVFGDGREIRPGEWVGNGRIPPEGAVVQATYRNRYAGFFGFARAMHKVDRSIDVCASWGTTLFATETRGRRYDCQTAHPLTNFARPNGHNWRRQWDGPLEGHDRMMLGLADRDGDVREMLRASPRRSPLWLTEFQPINGDNKNSPTWSVSVSNAVYMASQWAVWLRLGISFGAGGDLIGRGQGALFGTTKQTTYSVEAWVREAIKPMVSQAHRVVSSATRRNPTRNTGLQPRGAYRALSVVAARGPGGKVWVFVVNRLPSDKVRTKFQLRGMQAKQKAIVRRVAGDNFREANLPGGPQNVAMDVWTRNVNERGFKATLPPHSVTVFRVLR